jgi:tRNA A37 threonylcarbamoyladenosine dehydratase
VWREPFVGVFRISYTCLENPFLKRKTVMALSQFSRTQLLLGAAAMDALANARVAVFGVGGVGGYAAEGLARSGVGAIDLVDDDVVCLTNINRQIVATTETIGQYKADVMTARIRAINPHCQVRVHKCFYLPQTADRFDFADYDYIVDAVDTVTAKLALIERAHGAGTPIISSMGAGNKLDPTAFEVADISKTSVCPLAKIVRKELRKRGIDHVKVVYSKERPIRPANDVSISCRYHCVCPPEAQRHCTDKRDIPGSSPFVPPVVGMICASEAVRDLVAPAIEADAEQDA